MLYISRVENLKIFLVSDSSISEAKCTKRLAAQERFFDRLYGNLYEIADDDDTDSNQINIIV